MLSVAFRDTYAWLIAVCTALLASVFFLCNQQTHWCLGLIAPHGEVAYNVYAHNSIKINPARFSQLYRMQAQRNHVVDIADIEPEKFVPPTVYRSITDTVGYGVVLGLLWKLTHSLRYRDVQLLQIFILTLLMFFLYAISFMWFKDPLLARLTCASQLMMMPLFWLNALPLRDVWAYYGLVILLFGLSTLLQRKNNFITVGLSAFFYSLCMWVRPSIIFSLFFGICFLIAYALIRRELLVHLFKGALLICFINGVVFWAPFVAYNVAAHNVYLAGPSGQGLWQGMGEFDNEWGFSCSDSGVAQYIKGKYDLNYGTPAFDAAARKEFWRAFWQKPSHFFTSVARRVPKALLPTLILYRTSDSIVWLVLLLLSCLPFLLLGYLGIVTLILKKEWAFFFFVYGIGLLPLLFVLISHIEHRYLIPLYAMFSFFVGYFLKQLYIKRTTTI